MMLVTFFSEARRRRYRSDHPDRSKLYLLNSISIVC